MIVRAQVGHLGLREQCKLPMIPEGFRQPLSGESGLKVLDCCCQSRQVYSTRWFFFLFCISGGSDLTPTWVDERDGLSKGLATDLLVQQRSDASWVFEHSFA